MDHMKTSTPVYEQISLATRLRQSCYFTKKDEEEMYWTFTKVIHIMFHSLSDMTYENLVNWVLSRTSNKIRTIQRN